MRLRYSRGARKGYGPAPAVITSERLPMKASRLALELSMSGACPGPFAFTQPALMKALRDETPAQVRAAASRHGLNPWKAEGADIYRPEEGR